MFVRLQSTLLSMNFTSPSIRRLGKRMVTFSPVREQAMVNRVALSLALLSLSGYSFAQSSGSTRDYVSGNRTTFSTKDHPKAKGVHFTIAYPSSWSREEGERPNIVQKFVSEGGRGLESVMIITKDLPLSPGTVISEQDQKEFFSPSELRGMLPKGATLVDAQATSVDGTPAGVLEYTLRAENVGISLPIHAWTLNFISGITLVQVAFQVAGPPTGLESDVSRRMAQFKPLFRLIANSIVFPLKWTAAPEVATGALATSQSSPSLPYDDAPLLIASLIISFVVTWGLGLAPPLLIRYAFVRRPLSKKRASWLAAGFSVFFWMAFLVVRSALRERPGTGFVWIVMFFVARWIMSHGSDAGPVAHKAKG